jgi:hypothetical protein
MLLDPQFVAGGATEAGRLAHAANTCRLRKGLGTAVGNG